MPVREPVDQVGDAQIPPESQKSLKKVDLPVEDYASSHKPQWNYSLSILDCSWASFSKVSDASQQFLDVGCGPGDFTREVLLPRCQPCRRIVGIDCSQEMIEYAQRHSTGERIEFRQLDICSDVSGFLHEFGRFDRIYSFFCLNWAVDLTAALRNIAQLLTPNGECLLVYCASVETADVWRGLANMDRWAKYSEVLLKFIPDTQDMKDTREMMSFMSRILLEAGLHPSILEVPQSTVIHGWNEDDMLAAYLAVLPIAKMVSPEEKSELASAVRDQVRAVHGPNADKERYRNFVIKASRRES
ncbi:juvenile hormone acid O-methyltransferase-like [Amblyomma americanum]